MIKIIPNNNVIKFGASTRFFIFGSTLEENDSPENNMNLDTNDTDVTGDQIVSNEDSCSWGMQLTDCNDDEIESGDSFALKSIISAMKDGEEKESINKNAYESNPYKCILQWFEREGYNFDYKVDSVNTKFKCSIELPIDGQWITIESALTTRVML